MNFKIMALIVFAVVFIYRRMINVIRLRSANNKIPDNVADVYDSETYAKWKAYHYENEKFSLISNTVTFVLEILLLATNAYALFAGLFPENQFTQILGVMLLNSFVEVLMLPFSWYDTMVIEQKYGFNKTKPKTFFADAIKSYILTMILMVGISSMLFGLHESFGDWIILVFAIVMTLLILMITFLFPVFSKLFNKFTPLEDGELKEKINALLEKHNYKVRAINVMDASRRTTKSNAYFTGFGKMKTIVLYDTLVQNFTVDEICAVFAHEMGHGLHKDTLRNRFLTFVQMLVIGVLVWLTLRTPAIFTDFGFESLNYGFAIILIMSVEYAIFSPIFSLCVNYFSRKAEYGADRQAVEEGYGEQLKSALKKLAKENYSNLSPSPLLVKLEYSHPTLSQRIAAVDELLKEK
ncbi:MAG: M48 family metallopeptidase [Lachnospiraceae bacterium]|nr:M48 family metallopeptidase [Lachnospiraceae bacterium]